MNDVWVFNPKGWSRSQILGEAKSKYDGKTAGEILPTIDGYEFSTGVEEKTGLKQNFDNFRFDFVYFRFHRETDNMNHKYKLYLGFMTMLLTESLSNKQLKRDGNVLPLMENGAESLS